MNSRNRRVGVLWMTILLSLGVAGCAESGSHAESIQQPVITSWSDVVASLPQDDVGRYRVLSSNYARGVETKFEITLEARYYPELEQMRYVVTESGLRQEAHRAGGIEKMSLSMDDDHGTASAGAQHLTLVDLESVTPTATAMFEANPYDTANAEQVCGHLELVFVEESRMPVRLQACSKAGAGT